MWRGESPFVHLHKIKVMKIDQPQVINQVGGRNKITPRYRQSHNWKKSVGKTLRSNLFPTFLGKFLYRDEIKGRCYFEILPNPKITKYNSCAGKIEYIPEHHVDYMEFEKE